MAALSNPYLTLRVILVPLTHLADMRALEWIVMRPRVCELTGLVAIRWKSGRGRGIYMVNGRCPGVSGDDEGVSGEGVGPSEGVHG